MSEKDYAEMSTSEKKKEDWMNSKWRPMMGWLYMAVCAFDFVIYNILPFDSYTITTSQSICSIYLQSDIKSNIVCHSNKDLNLSPTFTSLNFVVLMSDILFSSF